MEYAAESGKQEIAEELLGWFLERNAHDCFAACLYQVNKRIWVDLVAMRLNQSFSLPSFLSVLRFAASRCYPGTGMETQNHGLCHALLDTGTEFIFNECLFMYANLIVVFAGAARIHHQGG